jgi:hypothetical protein
MAEERIQRLTGKLKRFASALRPSTSVLAVALLSSSLSVSGTFYVTTHRKPHLRVYSAHGMVSAQPDRDNANTFSTAIIELSSEANPKLPTPKIYSPKKVTFSSAKDYVWEPTRLVSIDKLFVENNGWVTAKNVRLGISVSESVDEPTVVASPNIRIAYQKFRPAGDNMPAYIDVEFDRLTVSDIGALTVLSRQKSKTMPLTSSSNIPFVSLETERPSRSLLFVASEEGVGEVCCDVSWGDAIRMERQFFPTTPTGYWLSNLTIKKGVVYKVEDDPKMQMRFEIKNKETGDTAVTTVSAEGSRKQ